MKLILIHGVAQGGGAPAQIKSDWLAALQLGGVRPAALAAAAPDLAWYGDLLATGTGAMPVADLLDHYQAKADFLFDAAREVASASAAILKTAAATPPASIDFAFAKRVLGQLAKGHQPLPVGQVIEGLGDTFDYLTQPNLRRAIDGRVAAFAEKYQPQTIVAHSLGSVVVYRLLRDRKIACQRLITIGSPLAFASLKPLLDGPFGWPSRLVEWRNFYDRLDPICLGGTFGHHSWGARLTHNPVENTAPDNHAAAGYLKAPEVGASIDERL